MLRATYLETEPIMMKKKEYNPFKVNDIRIFQSLMLLF